jgi:hypothetical protein
LTPEIPETEMSFKIGKGFATQVLNRIGELKLESKVKDKKGKARKIRDAVDYALEFLRPQDSESQTFFKLLLAYRHGKPVQPVMQADTRETAPELEFDGLYMPAGAGERRAGAAAKSAASRKPN